MKIFNFLNIFEWYSLLQFFGCMGFLLCFSFFQKLFDKGFIIGKASGMLLFSYFCWVIPSIGIFSYSRALIVFFLLLFFCCSIYSFRKNKNAILNFLQKNKKLLFIVEILFLLSLIIFILIRSYGFDFQTGEKLRDLSTITSIIRSESFPPNEVWLSGYKLNIYYFGHFVVANMIKLVGIEPSLGFRLATPTFLSLLLISSFGLIYNLTKKINYSILVGLLVAVMGNIDGLLQIIFFSPEEFYWWESAHIIPNTYQEFAFWSFSFGEVHAFFIVHVFVLLFLYCCLSLLDSREEFFDIKNFLHSSTVFKILFFSLCFGALGVINIWNYPSALILVIGLFFYLFFVKKKLSLKDATCLLFAIVFLSIFLYLPFYSSYSVPSSEFLLVPDNLRTSPSHLLVLFGAYILPVLFYSLIKGREIINSDKEYRIYYILALPLFVLSFISNSFVLIFSFVSGFAIFYLLLNEEKQKEAFILLLLILVFILLFVCEFIVPKDIFDGEYLRYNSLSKFYIQIQLLLPIISVYCIYYFSENIKKSERKWAMNVLIFLPIFGSFIFPIMATREISNNFNTKQNFSEIEAMREINPKEYEPILWLQQNIQGQPIILEAPGYSYDYESAHISSFTGLSTVVEWPQHLITWMGENFDDIIQQRVEDVKEIYDNLDKNSIFSLIEKYNIEYIFIGSKEKKEYSLEGLDSFKNFSQFEEVFDNQAVRIYRTSLSKKSF